MTKLIDLFHKKILIIFLILLIITTIILFFPSIVFNKVPGYNDVLLYSSWRFHIRQAFLNKEFPLWFPQQMGGIPSLVTYNPSLLYPFTLLLLFFDNNTFTNILNITHFIMIPLFMYFFLCYNKFEKIVSIITSMFWAWSGYILVRFWNGHTDYIIAFTYIPLILLFYQKSILEKKFILCWITAFFAGIQFFSGRPEYIIYTHILILFYCFYYLLIKKNNWKIILIKTLLFYLLFLFLITIQILPLVEFLKYSIRGTSINYATMISFPFKNLITFFLPYFFGDHLYFNFWGEQNFFEQYCYVGILPLLSLIFLFLVKNEKSKYFFGIFILLGILLATGKYNPLYPIIIKIIFPLAKLRAPARAMFFALFGFSLITALFLKNLYNSQINFSSKKFNTILIILLLISVLLFIIYLIPEKIFINFFKKFISIEKIKLPLSTFRWKLWHLALMLFLYSFSLLKFKNIKIIFLLFFVFAFYETIIFNRRYIDYNGQKINFSDDLIIQKLNNDNDFYRVLTNEHITANSKYNIHNIQTMLAFTPTYIKEVCDFIAIGIDGRMNYIEETYKTWFGLGFVNNYSSPLVDLFNVKYFIDYKIDNNDFIKIFDNLYLKKDYFPRFKFFYKSIYENSFSKTIEKLNDNNFNYKEIVIINNDEKNNLIGFNNSINENKIKLKKYNYNSIEFEVNINQDAILFLSEVYYPGWKVYVNGHERKLLKLNNIFRGVKCEKNDKVIKFVYKPFYLSYGLIFIFIFLGMGLFLFLF